MHRLFIRLMKVDASSVNIQEPHLMYLLIKTQDSGTLLRVKIQCIVCLSSLTCYVGGGGGEALCLRVINGAGVSIYIYPFSGQHLVLAWWASMNITW